MTLSDVTDRWNLLGVAATTLCTCIGGFLVLPAAGLRFKQQLDPLRCVLGHRPRRPVVYSGRAR